MYNFYQQFQKLVAPTTDQYSAFRVKGFENHRIAKDKDKNPNLLISLSKNYSNPIIQELYNIRITHNIECKIIEGNSNISDNFVIISYQGNAELIEYFLKICEVFINTLGNTPSHKQIDKVVAKFIELFRLFLEPPKKSLQGLWAELFFIAQANNIQKTVIAWHDETEDRFDFSFGSMRVEVKSSKSRARVHNFSLEQLTPIVNTQIYIASIFVETISSGSSIQNLLDTIEKKLQGNIELIDKVRFLVFSTLGDHVHLINNIKFDYQLALESLRVYDCENVPKIENEAVASEVSNVYFKSNLTDVDCIDVSNTSSWLQIK